MSNRQKRTRVATPAGLDRVPTGAMQFGSDWPGLFLRGDDAMRLVGAISELQEALVETSDPRVKASMARLTALADLIQRDVVEPMC